MEEELSKSTGTALGWVWWEEEKLGLRRVLTCQDTTEVVPHSGPGPLSVNQGGNE